jgi:hypothetical protein
MPAARGGKEGSASSAAESCVKSASVSWVKLGKGSPTTFGERQRRAERRQCKCGRVVMAMWPPLSRSSAIRSEASLAWTTRQSRSKPLLRM